jgi:hypothetical protein
MLIYDVFLVGCAIIICGFKFTQSSLYCISIADRIISELLAHLERPDLHPFERAEALNNLRGNISAIWGADEIR